MSTPPTTPLNPTTSPEPRRRRWPLVLGALALLLVGAALLLPRLVNPERYRAQIDAAISQATGWKAELGKIDVSVWSGLRLNVAPVTLASPGGESSLSAETVAIHAAVLPLLRGTLSITNCEVLRPKVKLVRTADKGWIVPQIRTAWLPTRASGPPIQSAGLALPVAIAPAVVIDEINLKGGTVDVEDRTASPARTLHLTDIVATFVPATKRVWGLAHVDGDKGRLKWKGTLGEPLVVDVDQLKSEALWTWIGREAVGPGGTLNGTATLTLPARIEAQLEGRNLTLYGAQRPLVSATAKLRLAADAQGEWQLAEAQVDAGGLVLHGSGALTPALDTRWTLPSSPVSRAVGLAQSWIALPVKLSDPGEVSAEVRLRQVGAQILLEGQGQLTAARLAIAEGIPPLEQVRARFVLGADGVIRLPSIEARWAEGVLHGALSAQVAGGKTSVAWRGGLTGAALAPIAALAGAGGKKITGRLDTEGEVRAALTQQAFALSSLQGQLHTQAQHVELPDVDLLSSVRKRLGKGDQADGGHIDLVRAGIDMNALPWAISGVRLEMTDLVAEGSGTFDPVELTVELPLTATLGPETSSQLIDRTRALRALADRSGRLVVPFEVSGPVTAPQASLDTGRALSQALSTQTGQETLRDLARSYFEKKKQELGPDKKKPAPDKDKKPPVPAP